VDTVNKRDIAKLYMLVNQCVTIKSLLFVFTLVCGRDFC